MSKQTSSLAPDLIEKYRQAGAVRVSLPTQLVEECERFLDEAATWLERMAGIAVDGYALPAVLPEIAVKDRALVGRLYKISRRFPSVKRLASNEWICDVSAQLMGTPLASCCHFVNVRMDLPGEEKYLLPPHQDFPYIQGSLNGVTWWIPFVATPLELGPPSWIAGSHKQGVLKVNAYDYEQTGRSGGRSFKIVGEDRFEHAQYRNEPVAFGEALILHTLVVHRSEINASKVARVNVQVRFDDALATESFSRNYPEGLYLGDAFGKSYPEYVSDE